MSFKIGDIVKPKSGNNGYTLTTETNEYVGEVVKMSNCEEYITLKQLEGIDMHSRNYEVRATHFFLVKSTIRFQDLKEGSIYSCMVGGAKDHGYEYELRKGRVYNLSKSKYSTMPFNTKTYFTELNTFRPVKFELDSLEYSITLHRDRVVIGCQTLTLSDVEVFCKEVEEKYDFKA